MAEETTDKPLEFNPDEEFASLYANNTQFESTIWDLKLIFGQVDLAKSAIEQHTAVALPWPHAKIAAYYLLVNVIIHQANNGPILLPSAALPTPPDLTLIPEGDVKAKNVAKYIRWVHEQLYGSNPYIPPGMYPEKI